MEHKACVINSSHIFSPIKEKKGVPIDIYHLYLIIGIR